MSSPRPGEVIFEVPAGVYRLVASRSGYQDGEKSNVNVTSDRPEEIQLTPIRYNLEVRVVDYKSRPISEATVTVYRAGQRVESRITGTDGRVTFQLEPGSYTVEAFKSGYKQPVQISVNLDRDRSESLTLPGYRLTVTVRDSRTGQPITGASVRVIDQSTGREVDSGTTA